MPNVTPVQSDFSVGEVAPDVQYRSTLEARNRGVKTLTNFVTDSHGPIIRRSGFRFLGKIGDPDGVKACEESVGYDSGSTQNADNIFNIDYSAPFGYIVISGDGLTSATNGLLVIREADGGIVYAHAGCTRSGHKIISQYGTQDRSLIAALLWNCGGAERTLYIMDMANSLAAWSATSLGNINTEICAERDIDIILADKTDNTRFWLADKAAGTAGLTNLQIDGAWFSENAAAFHLDGVSIPDSYLCCVRDGSLQFGFSVYTNQATLPAPSVLLGDVGSTYPGIPEAIQTKPIVVGTSVWWLIRVQFVQDAPRTYLVETDFAGNVLQSVPQFDTETYYNSRTGYDAIFYEASNNSIYYMYQETLWRYSLTSHTYHTCDAPIDPLFTAITDGRSSSFVRVNGYQWNAIIAYDAATKWGYEKIEAGF